MKVTNAELVRTLRRTLPALEYHYMMTGMAATLKRLEAVEAVLAAVKQEKEQGDQTDE